MADELRGSPDKAPEYAQHRQVATPDVAAEDVRAHGMNMASHRWALIQIVPANGANPNVAVQWWSEEAGEFVSENPALTKTGVGANTAFEFAVECLGRIMFVSVPTMAAGDCKIFVAGYGVEYR